MRTRGSSTRRTRAAGMLLLLTGMIAAAATPAAFVSMSTASAAAPAKMVVAVPKDAATPNPGTGIGTRAALDDPRCNTGERYGPYGRWNGSVVGGGPPCVVPLAVGADNGGATSRGVTRDAIKIVVVALAASEQTASATAITNRATGQPGTGPDAIHDWLTALMQYHETWGRDLDVVFYTSSGSDETAQRADAVAILAMKPFIVLGGGVAGLDVLEADLARGKVIVFGTAADAEATIAQAPYRWALTDSNSAMVNAAEVIGKQLVGKKAKWADSADLQGTIRKFGLIHQESIPIDRFAETLAKYKGRLATESSYRAGASGSATLGDAALAQEQAPVIVSKMKESGVTTVVVAADIAMVGAMMKQATAQEWYPEWFLTASGYVDYPGFLALYPADQADQMFGLSLLWPYLKPEDDPQAATLGRAGDPLAWYWGAMKGSDGAGVPVPLAQWLMIGIHMAGPNLTPKTFERGLFSNPLGNPSPLLSRTAYGKQAGLPYPSRANSTVDFVPIWIAPDVSAAALPSGVEQKPSVWFVDEARRYRSGEWPAKELLWFDAEASISHFETRPASVPAIVRAPCAGCPSTGESPLTPGTPDQNRFVVKAAPSTSAAK